MPLNQFTFNCPFMRGVNARQLAFTPSSPTPQSPPPLSPSLLALQFHLKKNTKKGRERENRQIFEMLFSTPPFHFIMMTGHNKTAFTRNAEFITTIPIRRKSANRMGDENAIQVIAGSRCAKISFKMEENNKKYIYLHEEKVMNQLVKCSVRARSVGEMEVSVPPPPPPL